MRLRLVWLVANHATRHSLRGGVGLVFVLLALTFGVLAAQAIVEPVEREIAGAPGPREESVARIVDNGRPAVEWLLDVDAAESLEDVEAAGAALRELDEWVDHLLVRRPALLSWILLVLTIGWPLVVACGTFDLFAGDIRQLRLRFLLLHVDRGSLYFGRVLGAVLTQALVLVVLMATVLLYLGLRLGVYDWAALAGWSLHGLGALFLLGIPYAALCSWLSAIVPSSTGSLLACTAVVGGVPLMAMVMGAMHRTGGFIDLLLPWGIQRYLYHHEPGTVALTALGCLGYAAVFLFLGHRVISRRDL